MATTSPLVILLVVGLAVPRAVADAGPAYLVKDLNPAPVDESDSDPRGFAVLDGVAYFAAVDGIHGGELWRSDGTADGTRLFADLNPGEGGSVPRDLTVVGDALWFRAWDGRRGCGLWRSDGTEAGTREVAVIHTNIVQCGSRTAEGGNPTAFTAFGNDVAFAASTPETGLELWRSDGSTAGTTRVADIFSGPEGSAPRALTALDGVLYFVADDGVHGDELWRSNGTAAGTRLVRDINDGAASGIAHSLFGSDRPQLSVVGDVLLFAGDDGAHGAELWRSDGTAGGTRLLVDTAPGFVTGGLRVGGDGSITAFAPLADRVTFFSLALDQAQPRVLVWSSDGSAAGTQPIGELPFSGPSAPANLTPVGDSVYFSYRAGLDGALWRIDGDGVAEVAPIAGRPDRIGAFTALGDQLLFLAPFAETGCGLWRSDALGTQLVRGSAPTRGECPDDLQISAPGTYVVALGARALLAEADQVRGAELFASDGTTAGTQLLRDINDTSARTQGSQISLQDVGVLDDVLLFSAAPGEGQPAGLWRSDGSAAGTRLLASVSGNAGGVVGERFVFTGFDDRGAAIWSSDGSVAGTVPVQSIIPGPWGVTATPAAVFLTLDQDEAGAELWRSDGTTAGTFRVADLTPGPSGTSFGPRAPFAGGLAFVVQRQAGDELWRSDGGEVGTHMVTAFSGSSNRVRTLLDVDGVLYLDLAGLSSAGELWRSDGSAGGTVRIADLSQGDRAATIGWLAAGPGALFFAAADAATGLELWRSDGTAEHTGRVRDILPLSGSGLADPDGSIVQRTARVADAFLVVADDGTHGPELWRSDGSEAGTVMLRDIDPRARQIVDDFALPLTPVGGRVLFAPLDVEAGVEPWITDGTEAGTHRVADIAPGVVSGLRQGAPFAVTRTHVFMAADDRVHGRELWAIPRAALDGGPACAGDCNGDFHVAIDELIRGVGIALGSAPVSVCASFDRDGDGGVSIAELVGAVAAALDGC